MLSTDHQIWTSLKFREKPTLQIKAVKSTDFKKLFKNVVFQCVSSSPSPIYTKTIHIKCPRQLLPSLPTHVWLGFYMTWGRSSENGHACSLAWICPFLMQHKTAFNCKKCLRNYKPVSSGASFSEEGEARWCSNSTSAHAPAPPISSLRKYRENSLLRVLHEEGRCRFPHESCHHKWIISFCLSRAARRLFTTTIWEHEFSKAILGTRKNMDRQCLNYKWKI